MNKGKHVFVVLLNLNIYMSALLKHIKFLCLCIIKATFKTGSNEHCTSALLKDIRSLNPSFSSADIRGKSQNLG